MRVLGGTGRPLDVATRKFFESRFGHDLSHVRVHTDAKVRPILKATVEIEMPEERVERRVPQGELPL